MANKQTPAQQRKIEKVMHEFKQGELESSSGQTVKNRKQAVAIALHEAGASRDQKKSKRRKP